MQDSVNDVIIAANDTFDSLQNSSIVFTVSVNVCMCVPISA